MKETTYTIDIPNEPTPAERRRARAKKKKKRRLFFVLFLVALFVLSYAITALVLYFSADKPETPAEPEAEPVEKIEISAPTPVTDPKLPSIIENKEPEEEPSEEEPVEEDPTEEEPSDEPTEEEPSEEEPSEEDPVEEESSADESRSDGLR